MKRVIPNRMYEGKPCSVVSVGCAMGLTDSTALAALRSPFLRNDMYLSLRGMDTLIRSNLSVSRVEYFRKGERPALRDFAHSHRGQKAIICLVEHFVYFDGKDYHSFFLNGGDPVVQAWYLRKEKDL